MAYSHNPHKSHKRAPEVDTGRMTQYARRIIENSRRDANISRDLAKPHRHR